MNIVYVFGTDKFKLHEDIKIRYNTVYPPPKKLPYRVSDHMVEIYNEKLGVWQPYPCNETIIECPVCKKLMKVYYIPGTTWIAFCSDECAEKFDKKRKELGSMLDTISYFRKVMSDEVM